MYFRLSQVDLSCIVPLPSAWVLMLPPRLSPPGHADELPASGGRCDCAFEWRCLPHDMCFVHDSCLCDGSGSYPPVKPPHDWARYSRDWYVDYAPLTV